MDENASEQEREVAAKVLREIERGRVAQRCDLARIARRHRYYAAAAVGEGVIALGLAVYLGSKYGHYQCG